MKTQITLLAHKIWSSGILEYFLKDVAMKEFASAMDITNTSCTQEIMGHNKCQLRFLDKFLFKQTVDKN